MRTREITPGLDSSRVKQTLTHLTKAPKRALLGAGTLGLTRDNNRPPLRLKTAGPLKSAIGVRQRTAQTSDSRWHAFAQQSRHLASHRKRASSTPPYRRGGRGPITLWRLPAPPHPTSLTPVVHVTLPTTLKRPSKILPSPSLRRIPNAQDGGLFGEVPYRVRPASPNTSDPRTLPKKGQKSAQGLPKRELKR